MVQLVKNPALLLLGWLLWCGFSPWPRLFPMLSAWLPAPPQLLQSFIASLKMFLSTFLGILIKFMSNSFSILINCLLQLAPSIYLSYFSFCLLGQITLGISSSVLRAFSLNWFLLVNGFLTCIHHT